MLQTSHKTVCRNVYSQLSIDNVKIEFNYNIFVMLKMKMSRMPMITSRRCKYFQWRPTPLVLRQYGRYLNNHFCHPNPRHICAFENNKPPRSRGKVRVCSSFVFKNLGDCSDTSLPALNFWIFFSFMVCLVIFTGAVVKMIFTVRSCKQLKFWIFFLLRFFQFIPDVCHFLRNHNLRQRNFTFFIYGLVSCIDEGSCEDDVKRGRFCKQLEFLIFFFQLQ